MRKILKIQPKSFTFEKSVVTDITSWRISNFKYLHEGIFYGGWPKVVIAYGRAVSYWLMCFAFIGLAHRYLNKPSAKIRYLADSAYWVYWIHLPLTFGLSKVAQQFELNSLTKSYVIMLFSTFIIYFGNIICIAPSKHIPHTPKYKWYCNKSNNNPRNFGICYIFKFTYHTKNLYLLIF